jgi:hypothetical protein
MFENEKSEALKILEGIENGTMTAVQSFQLIEQADPTLIHFIFTWLKQTYSRHPAADAVLGRLLAVCSTYPAAAAIAKEGQADSLVEWFEEAYKYTDFGPREFIELIVEKLEG